jgi:hypothetical protein
VHALPSEEHDVPEDFFASAGHNALDPEQFSA